MSRSPKSRVDLFTGRSQKSTKDSLIDLSFSVNDSGFHIIYLVLKDIVDRGLLDQKVHIIWDMGVKWVNILSIERFFDVSDTQYFKILS